MQKSLSKGELRLFKKDAAKCLHCGEWHDTDGMDLFHEFPCEQCSRQVMKPMRISTFWLYKAIGEGGMGRVFLAQQPDDDKLYAIKISECIEDDFNFNCLLYEGEIIQELAHPNIPTMHTFGYKSGKAFLLMNYLKGTNLEDFIFDGPVWPIPLDMIYIWLNDLVDVLDYMESKKYIFRDLKPQNIMVDETKAVLVDFGLALHLDHSKEIDDENLIGSPAYIPPERVEGKEEDVRSDIYSLGMVIYFTAAGANYFEADSHEELAQMHLQTERQDVVEKNSYIDKDLGKILNKMIAYKPEDRYQHYSDIKADLKGLVKK